MEMLSQIPQAVNPNPIEVEPVTTGESDWGFLSFFKTDDEGCTVRYGIEQKFYRLAATMPNYNALYSLLLACWINHYKVELTYRLPVRLPNVPPTDPNAPPTYKIVSVYAMNVSSQA